MSARLKIILGGLVLLLYCELQGQEPEYDDAPLQFRCVGPSRGGRVTSVRGVTGDPATFYMGSSGGGVWKTTDYGNHWTNISDGFFESPSIGAIAVFQEDPDILYVGTGSDAIRSNVIVGRGIYKSEDAGQSWTHMGLRDAGQIGALEIHPENPDVAFAAVMGQPFRKSDERGVYRTRNGGESWEKVLFLSDSVGAVDLELVPGSPEIVYAAMWRAERKPWTIISGGAQDGIFKSTDGGETWKRVTKGLPTSMTGKIDFAVSPDKPSRVWAQIQASGEQGGIYRSDDYGESWTRAEIPERIRQSIMQRPFYFTNLSANPRNADRIWSGAVGLFTSGNGGKDWDPVRVTHGDHHDLWIHPEDTLVMIEGNDGGAAISRDGGKNWSSLLNQATAELYSCDVDDRYPYRIYSGQQDNTSISVPSRPLSSRIFSGRDYSGTDDVWTWETVGGCETGPVVPKPGDPNIVYTNCKGCFGVFHRDSRNEMQFYVGAQSLYGTHPDDLVYRFQRVAPLEVSPHHSNVVYYGSQYVHRSMDGGRNWERISPDLTANLEGFRMRSGGPIDEDITGEESYAVLYAIEESPLQEGVIWAGSNDGPVHVSLDGGGHWEDVTPPMPPGGRVSNIDSSPHFPGKALVAVNRDYLGDERPWLFLTTDFGKSWSLLSGQGTGIPMDHPARVIREDPEREGLLFAGTEFGIFMSLDNGQNWQPFQRGLPVTPVTDLRIYRNDLVLSTMGRSFWVMDDVSALRSYVPGGSEAVLYTPRDVYNQAQQVCFYLPETMREETFRVSWYRGDSVLCQVEDSVKNLEPDALGICQVSWDQHHYLQQREETLRGARVAPGEYRVVMELGKYSAEESFRIRMDPVLEAQGVSRGHLAEQESLAMEAFRLKLEIEAEIDRLEKELKQSGRKARKDDYEDQISALRKGPRPYDRPGLLDQVNYLYRMMSMTPQEIGNDGKERLSTLQSSWADYRDSGH